MSMDILNVAIQKMLTEKQNLFLLKELLFLNL